MQCAAVVVRATKMFQKRALSICPKEKPLSISWSKLSFAPRNPFGSNYSFGRYCDNWGTRKFAKSWGRHEKSIVLRQHQRVWFPLKLIMYVRLSICDWEWRTLPLKDPNTDSSGRQEPGQEPPRYLMALLVGIIAWKKSFWLHVLRKTKLKGLSLKMAKHQGRARLIKCARSKSLAGDKSKTWKIKDGELTFAARPRFNKWIITLAAN